jgi:hypothetical protein
MWNPAKTYGSRKTDRERLKTTGVVLELEEPGGKQMVIIVGKPEGFAAMSTGRITAAHLEQLINTWRAGDYKPNSIAGMYSTVRAVFSHAEKRC